MNSSDERQFGGNSPSDDEKKDPHSDGVYDSPELFQGRKEITICHNGECYRLRQTRTGKLILNK